MNEYVKDFLATKLRSTSLKSAHIYSGVAEHALLPSPIVATSSRYVRQIFSRRSTMLSGDSLNFKGFELFPVELSLLNTT